MYQIGEVAEAVGLSLRTIRHYEEVGLVPPSGRTAGGFRLYTDDDVERLRLIKYMKPLEFSLEDMRDLLEVRARLEDGRGNASERHRLVDRLRMYASTAEQRCERLREQLAAAESFAATLHGEAIRQGPARKKSRR